jgi:predicted metal-dependent hydrolase
MNTEKQQININGLTVEVVHKAIKNLHLGVYPPLGRVRVAAPIEMSDNAINLAVIGKLGWIKRQQEKYKAQPRQSKREMVSGESHYFLGRRYRIHVIEHNGASKVEFRSRTIIDIFVRPETNAEQREQVLQQWYRAQLKTLVPPLLEKWQPVLGVQVADWRIKKMKTRWGTCNIEAGRIWLNLELAKNQVQCLEYIIVHEMIHLIERHHNERFQMLMDNFLPSWSEYRAKLNRSPLGHADWDY